MCPPLNTWNGWSSFQEVCFQRQREEKGRAAAWCAKRSEFRCHLDPGDPFTPLPSAAITQRAALPLLTACHEKETMQPKWGEVRPGREVLWKKASQESEDLDHFPLIESMWPHTHTHKKNNFHFLIVKWPSSQFFKNECSDLKKGIIPKVHWNPNKDCLHLTHYNCQISNRIKSELLIHFPKFE